MTTLTSAPVAPLLARLFAEAAAQSPATDPAFAAILPEERERLMRSRADYRMLYTELKDYALPVSPDTGRLLYLLARAVRARAIVEFGTSFGLSTLHLAAALRDNGGGRLVTSEFEPSKVARASANLAAGGLADLVDIRVGDALETLASDLPETVDLLLLDGAKSLYRDVLLLVEPRLRPGAVIVADNADYCPEHVAHVGAVANGYISLPFTDEVMLSVRLG
ncbi:class I SAM-dependent methyltransferase [Sphingomonas sp. AR_OL41]|uniref:O-methyltransferase n=1 Tax=Sphingomonas sp. AR_OL41 TaxID=3042729 RepID=UPI0024818892|nr:class I SAM-dependent methyltransferase [Sphingomonas sp. AR_OL41]MDH7976075.1 class I SAM-dependent methyltransferase [Sphingomonas sp. AR_OL41]